MWAVQGPLRPEFGVAEVQLQRCPLPQLSHSCDRRFQLPRQERNLNGKSHLEFAPSKRRCNPGLRFA